jgi:hypothetical protein
LTASKEVELKIPLTPFAKGGKGKQLCLNPKPSGNGRPGRSRF